MKRILALSIAATLLAGLRADVAESQEARGSVEVQIPISYNYLVQLPAGYTEDADRPWPVLLFLHGAGERGDDLDLVRVHGPPRILTEGGSLPFIVVSPQCPEGFEWMPEVLLSLLDQISRDYRVDEDRVVVTGLSMGGKGTWNLGATEPERFAAIAPICGWGDPELAPRLAGLPTWVFHGALDEVVALQGSTGLVNALNELDASVRFTVYPYGDHGDAWKIAYNESGLFEWLEQAKRP